MHSSSKAPELNFLIYWVASWLKSLISSAGLFEHVRQIPSTTSAHQPTSPPARSRQPQKTTFPFLKVSEENSVKPGPNQLTKAPVVSWLGPTFTKKRPRNVQKMKNAVLGLASNFFLTCFYWLPRFARNFNPPKWGLRFTREGCHSRCPPSCKQSVA